MEMTLFGDIIWFQPEKPDLLTPGGLHIPEFYAKVPFTATVLRVGPGRWTKKGEFVPTTVKEGDTILVDSTWVGEEFSYRGTDYFLVREPDILAVVERTTWAGVDMGDAEGSYSVEVERCAD